MERSNKTAREIWQEVKANPSRARFGYGRKAVVDTVVVTGGSTSGCVRALAVDSLSRGYRTIVPEQCVADKHESYHYASLTDLMLKYADVVDVNETLAWLAQQKS